MYNVHTCAFDCVVWDVWEMVVAVASLAGRSVFASAEMGCGVQTYTYEIDGYDDVHDQRWHADVCGLESERNSKMIS